MTNTQRVTVASAADNTKRITSTGIGASSTYDPWNGSWGTSWGTSWLVTVAATVGSPAPNNTDRVTTAATAANTNRITAIPSGGQTARVGEVLSGFGFLLLDDGGLLLLEGDMSDGRLLLEGDVVAGGGTKTKRIA